MFNQDRFTYEAADHKVGWIMSYADLITILLTFMILLLSISDLTQTRFDMLVEALTGEKVGNLNEVKAELDEVIEVDGLTGEVSTTLDEFGLKVEFSNALLFASGESELSERGETVFRPFAQKLVAGLDPIYGVVVEGYTDDVPISNSRFRSNWELSTSRAIHVMERLTAAGIDRRRVSVQGFADTRAATEVDLLDDKTKAELSEAELEDARSMNRRVILRIDELHEDVLGRLLKPVQNEGGEQ